MPSHSMKSAPRGRKRSKLPHGMGPSVHSAHGPFFLQLQDGKLLENGDLRFNVAWLAGESTETLDTSTLKLAMVSYGWRLSSEDMLWAPSRQIGTKRIPVAKIGACLEGAVKSLAGLLREAVEKEGV